VRAQLRASRSRGFNQTGAPRDELLAVTCGSVERNGHPHRLGTRPPSIGSSVRRPQHVPPCWGRFLWTLAGEPTRWPGSTGNSTGQSPDSPAERQAAKACGSTVESALAGPRVGACQRSIVVRMAAGADSVL
jgi:hypothetical protein